MDTYIRGLGRDDSRQCRTQIAGVRRRLNVRCPDGRAIVCEGGGGLQPVPHGGDEREEEDDGDLVNDFFEGADEEEGADTCDADVGVAGGTGATGPATKRKYVKGELPLFARAKCTTDVQRYVLQEAEARAKVDEAGKGSDTKAFDKALTAHLKISRTLQRRVEECLRSQLNSVHNGFYGPGFYGQELFDKVHRHSIYDKRTPWLFFVASVAFEKIVRPIVGKHATRQEATRSNLADSERLPPLLSVALLTPLSSPHAHAVTFSNSACKRLSVWIRPVR